MQTQACIDKTSQAYIYLLYTRQLCVNLYKGCLVWLYQCITLITESLCQAFKIEKVVNHLVVTLINQQCPFLLKVNMMYRKEQHIIIIIVIIILYYYFLKIGTIDQLQWAY